MDKANYTTVPQKCVTFYCKQCEERSISIVYPEKEVVCEKCCTHYQLDKEDV